MTISLAHLRRCSTAVDLGAARTRVYVKNQGLVVDAPTVAAVNIRTGAMLAVGDQAELMDGRTPDYIRVVRPVSGGTIVDIDMAQRLLRHLVGDKLRKSWRRRRSMRAAVCLPYGSQPLSQRAAVETLTGLGARQVELVDTLIAAAVGCGLPVEHPEATMIVVCGAGTTQVAVLSLGSIVAAETVPVGGNAIDHAVIQHLRLHHELMLPGRGVRPLHLLLSTTGGLAQGSTEVHGRDLHSGQARSVNVDAERVRHAIATPLTSILDGIGAVLRRCPPDLVADLGERGIMLAGGSALIPGLETMINQATTMPVHIADRPGTCAVQGLGAMIEGKVQPLHLDPMAP
ncbi:rod shape-determining protein [Streptomyces piniterrae]|uniref:Cell shape-determining protein MreB n=1 Tax=Streptomyces piniterrae TaxID=2571125 RepID=A0A4U0NMS5_9ACTN|nr:rod shape-determining protein [Streptomyces piniterrae]TJZ55687.1 rod shape-determining protein [Streptomyces piniterrae]